MNQMLEARRSVKMKVLSNEKLDRLLHILVTLMLVTNMILILYAMLSITLRMTLGGVGLVDTLPIALYILPLMIFLPLMTRAYYKERSAVWSFIFLIIASVFFVLLSSLIRGFLICFFFNIVALISIFIMGRFRPKQSLRKVGKTGLAYIILLNMLGLTFPVAVVMMGQNPIAITTLSTFPQTSLTIPLSDFDYPYQNITPTAGLLSDIMDNEFLLDFKVEEDNITSWSNLKTWLGAINQSDIEYSVTLVSNRSKIVGENPDSLATTELIDDIFSSHSHYLNTFVNDLLRNMTNMPITVYLDMTLSLQEWQALMHQTRSLNLVGFGDLTRSSLYSTSLTNILTWTDTIKQQVQTAGFDVGLVVESFVIDDLQDGDTGVMRFCGVTTTSIYEWDKIQVSCERSRFSLEMSGDVGEYLIHSFSSSIGRLGTNWSIRIGEIGNSTDLLGRLDTTYDSLETLGNDIALAAGNGVTRLTLSSLSSLLSSFGDSAISQLRSTIETTTSGIATYTFRIYAFRAVIMAIDAFDFIMF